LPEAAPKVGGLTIFPSPSDDEAEIVVVEPGFGAKGFGAFELNAGFGANILAEFVADFGENRLDVAEPSLGANRFDVGADVGLALGTKMLETWVLDAEPNIFEDV
jgi:hypothetical protein